MGKSYYCILASPSIADHYRRFEKTCSTSRTYSSVPLVIGICGLNRDPYSGGSIGRIRRLYVLKEFRRHGAGRRLVEAVIHKASSHYTKLVLKTDNPKAAEFYKNLGFKEIADDEIVTHELEL
ncbi:GNAT family N-acetyltransferase [Yersinia pestis]|nr:GNAT family N-acetyltransferase [Yersinia pestis]